jgi:hypothetical protein
MVSRIKLQRNQIALVESVLRLAQYDLPGMQNESITVQVGEPLSETVTRWDYTFPEAVEQLRTSLVYLQHESDPAYQREEWMRSKAICRAIIDMYGNVNAAAEARILLDHTHALDMLHEATTSYAQHKPSSLLPIIEYRIELLLEFSKKLLQLSQSHQGLEEERLHMPEYWLASLQAAGRDYFLHSQRSIDKISEAVYALPQPMAESNLFKNGMADSYDYTDTLLKNLRPQLEIFQTGIQTSETLIPFPEIRAELLSGLKQLLGELKQYEKNTRSNSGWRSKS